MFKKAHYNIWGMWGSFWATAWKMPKRSPLMLLLWRQIRNLRNTEMAKNGPLILKCPKMDVCTLKWTHTSKTCNQAWLCSSEPRVRVRIKKCRQCLEVCHPFLILALHHHTGFERNGRADRELWNARYSSESNVRYHRNTSKWKDKTAKTMF